MNCTNTMVIEKVSGDTVAGEYEIDGLELDMGGAKAVAKGKLKSERATGSPVGGGRTEDPKTAGKPEPKKPKTIEEVVKDYEKLPGIFTLYRKTELGRDTIYMEIKESQLDQIHLMEVTASTGAGSNSQIVAGNP